MAEKALAAREDRLYTRAEMENVVNQAISFALKQGVPHHRHMCTEGHEWFCSSCYCEDVNNVPRTCVDHGGVPPIVKGQEPWRGGTR